MKSLIAGVLGCVAAFGQQVVITSPQEGEIISGWYNVNGWAMSSSNGPAMWVTVNGQSANMGDTAPGLCSSFPGVWCNSDGSINAGWDLTLNTTAMVQGAQTLTAQAMFATQASTSVDVTIDQPPTVALTSSPSSGVGNGMFTFTINSAAGASVIEGAIGPLSAGCGFIFYPSAGELTLYGTNQYVTLGTATSNGYCQVNADSSFTSNGATTTLNLDITFLPGLPGTQQISMMAMDSYGVQSDWQALGYWNTEASPVTIISFSPGSGAVGAQVTINGNNFGSTQGTVTFGGVAASTIVSWTNTVIVADVPAGAVSGLIAVTAYGVTVTSSGPFSVATTPTVTIEAPTLGLMISGSYQMSGWALDTGTVINPNSVQIAVNSSVVDTAIYGAARPDVCATYPGRPGCPNVGWTSHVIDTTTLTQGVAETLTVSATNEDSPPVTGSASTSVMFDQPPTVTLLSAPPSNSRSGTFSFAVTSTSGVFYIQAVIGPIAMPGTIDLATMCVLQYEPDDNVLFVGGAFSQLASGLGGTACQVSPGGTYTPTSNGLGGTLTLNITFSPGVQGTENISMQAFDMEDVSSEWVSAGTFNLPPAPVISSVSPTPAGAGMQVTINGSNFGTTQGSSTIAFGGVLATGIVSWSATQIVVTVPVGAGSGITVTVYNSPATYAFSILPSPNVGIEAPPAYSIISGTYQMSGWALDATTLINPNSIQASVGNITLNLMNGPWAQGYYGTARPDVCSNYPTSAGCEAGGNVGWYSYVDTTSLPPGVNEVLTVSATDEDPTPLTGSASTAVTIDQPPTITLSSTPAGGYGGGAFSFTAQTSLGGVLMFNVIIGSAAQWQTEGECWFEYYPGSGELTMVNSGLTGWTTGTLSTGLSNNACSISPSGTYTPTSDGLSGTLTIPITFSGLLGTQPVTMDALDNYGVSGGGAASWNATVPGPANVSFSPGTGNPGSAVQITGSGFGSSQGTSEVLFSGASGPVQATVTAWSDTSISVTVPSAAFSGPIMVAVNTVLATSSASFGVGNLPGITRFEPTSGMAGYTVTITGINFGSSQAGCSVTFTGISGTQIVQLNATIIGWSVTSLTVTVPNNTVTGPIAVTANGFSVSSSQPFTGPSDPPGITSISPTVESSGAQVVIYGNGFGTSGTVTFGVATATATVVGWSGSYIVALVPSNAISGPVTVTPATGTAAGMKLTSAQTFTVGAPAVTFYPASGQVGTEVWVYGSGFGSSGTLRFGGTAGTVATTILSWTDTLITAYVPAGAASGPIAVDAVGAPYGVFVSGTPFDVVQVGSTTFVALDPPPALVSGTYYMSGTAWDSTTTISGVTGVVSNPPTTQPITFAATYGAYRPDGCTAWWPGCPNVGWTYALDSVGLNLIGTEFLTITAASTAGTAYAVGTIFVDQPPSVSLTTPGSSGGGNFAFTVTTTNGIQTDYWIMGMIAPSYGATQQCSFTFYPGPSVFSLDNVTWVKFPLASSLSSSQCIINTDSSFDSSKSQLTLDITFPLGAFPVKVNSQGQQQALVEIWTDTVDDWNLDSGWVRQEAAWNTLLTISPATLPGGQQGTSYSQTLTATGGTGQYTWSYTGTLPPGVSMSGSTLSGTLTTAGTYTFTVTVKDSSGDWGSQVYTVAVTASTPTSFTMSQSSPSSITVAPTGAQGSFNESFQGANGFGTTVYLSYTGGGGLQFSPASLVVSGPSAIVQPITVTAPWATAANTYRVAITAAATDQSGTHTQTSYVTVTVTQQPTFSMGPTTPFPVMIPADGNLYTFSQTIYGQYGFSGQVSLLPIQSYYLDSNNNHVSFTTVNLTYASTWYVDPVTGTGSAIGQVIASTGALAGNYYFQYALTGGGAGYTSSPFTVAIVVSSSSQTSDFQLGIPSVSASIAAGGPPYVFTEAITSTSKFNSPVTFSTSGWPGGVTATITPSTVPSSTGAANISGTATISIQAASGTAATTNQPLSITASGGGKQHSVSVSLSVSNNATFSLSASPGSQTANSSGSASYQISVTGAANFAGTVGFNVTGLPAGSTSSFDSTVTGTGATMMNVTVPPVAVQTTYTLVVAGTSGNLGTSVVVPLIVPASPAVPATMISPYSGQTIVSRTVNFSWTPGAVVSGYKLVVGTGAGLSDVYSATTTAQKATVQITGSPTVLYATLSSQIAGVWNPVPQYTYLVNLTGSSAAGSPTVPLASPGLWSVFDDDQANLFANRQLIFTPSGQVGDCSVLTGCQVEFLWSGNSTVMNTDPNTTATLTSSPTSPTSSPPYCNVTVTATYSATTGQRAISCFMPADSSGVPSVTVCPGLPGCAAGSAVLQINAATPKIVGDPQQPSPIYPAGHPQYITIWGTSFGPTQGYVGYCVTGAVELLGCGNGYGAYGDDGLSLKVTYWSPLQIDVEVTALANACTPPCTYDIVVRRSDGADPANQPNSGRVKGIQVSAVPTITGISPAMIPIATTTDVTITGTGLAGVDTVSAQGIAFTIKSAVNTQVVATANVGSADPGGTVPLTVSAGGVASNSTELKKQVPSRLVRFDYPPGAPNGIGPLQTPVNGNVVNLAGQVLSFSKCGVYRNYAFDLVDQDGESISATYTFVEYFTDYSGVATTPAPQQFEITPNSLLADIQYLGKTYPSCLGPNDNETFNQKFYTVFGGNQINLSTVINVQRGSFDGVLAVNESITTP